MEELLRIGRRCEIIEPGTTKNENVPDSLSPWDVRRTALPRSLLNNRVTASVEHGNGSDGLLWKLVRSALGPTESQAKRRRVLGLLLLEVRCRPLDRGA